jgi:hypothetical protein
MLLSGCAAMHQLDSDVSSFGTWPADRAPGTFAFERLPSQAAQADAQARLEAAAAPALAAAGFRLAAEGAPADVTVQLAARVTRTDRWAADDALWWHTRFGVIAGPGWAWSMHDRTPRYDREVAVLIRDRASGAVLYESRATSDGLGSTSDALLAAMFEAALKDFPGPAVSPRRVTVDMR